MELSLCCCCCRCWYLQHVPCIFQVQRSRHFSSPTFDGRLQSTPIQILQNTHLRFNPYHRDLSFHNMHLSPPDRCRARIIYRNIASAIPAVYILKVIVALFPSTHPTLHSEQLSDRDHHEARRTLTPPLLTLRQEGFGHGMFPTDFYLAPRVSQPTCLVLNLLRIFVWMRE